VVTHRPDLLPRTGSWCRWITVVPKEAIRPAPELGYPLLDSVVQKSARLDGLTRRELIDVVRDLRTLHEKADVPTTENIALTLGDAWEKVAERCENQVRTLLPHDLAYLLDSLAACDKRYPQLVKAINQHIRRIPMSFTADDMSLCLGAYAHMKWRSKGTIATFAKRFGEILANPQTAQQVDGRHMRKMIGVYPALRIPWVPGGDKFSKDHPAVKLWLTVANRIPGMLDAMSPRDFSVLLNAYAKHTHAFAGESRGEKTISRFFQTTLKHLAPRLAMEPKTFTSRDVALLCHSYGIIVGDQLHKPSVGPILLQPFFEAVKLYVKSSDLETWNPIDISLVCNSFTKVDFVEMEVFDLLAPHIIDRVRLFNPQNLSNVAHAYAKVQVKNEPLFDRIGDFAARTIDKFNPQGLGNLAYAFGKVYHKHDTLMNQLKDEVIYRATVGRRMARVDTNYRFDLRTVEQLSHAYSRLHYHDQHIFCALMYLFKREVNRQAKYTTRQAPRVSPGMETKLDAQGLSVILTSFVKAGATPKGLGRWAAKHFFKLENDFNTWQLVTIFSALSRMEFTHQPLFDHVQWLAKERMTTMSPKALAMLIHSMSNANQYDRVLFRQWTKQGQIHLRDFDGVDLLQISTALADERYRDAKFFRLLMEALRARWHELKPGHMAGALRACSRMRIADSQPWFDFVLIALFERQHELSEKEAVTTLYSLMSLGITERWTSGADMPVSEGKESIMKKHEAVVHAMLQKANEHRSRMRYESIYQLQMLELYLKFLEPEVYELLSVDEKDLLARARRVNVVVDDYMQSSSRMHRRIAKVFTRVGLHHRSEVYVGPFMLDIVLGSRNVVEIDGPSHFFQDTNMRTTASLLKHTILEKMGYSVQHLPWQEWNQCGTYHKRLLYCASFWKELLQEPGSLGGPTLADVVEALEEARELDEKETKRMLAEFAEQDIFTEIDRMPGKSASEKKSLRNAVRMRRQREEQRRDEDETDDEGEHDETDDCVDLTARGKDPPHEDRESRHGTGQGSEKVDMKVLPHDPWAVGEESECVNLEALGEDTISAAATGATSRGVSVAQS